MASNIRYPLTEEAKETARYLVELWMQDNIDQYFVLLDDTSLNSSSVEVTGGLGTGMLASPNLSAILELAEYKLISVQRHVRIRTSHSGHSYEDISWGILLLRELRNAVSNDFMVSDYFLTITAVGNIFIGTSIINSPVQGTGQALAPVTQNAEIIAREIKTLLGEDFYEENAEIKQAIDEFEDASAEDILDKGKALVARLAQILEGTTKAAAVIAAIQTITTFITNLP